MNCQEALSLLYDIIDKEASEIDSKQVEEHLSRCRHCSELYRVEKSVNDLLLAKLQEEKATPKVDALKSKVLSELDAIDGEMRQAAAEETGNSAASPPFRIGRIFAIAATIVIAVGAFYYGARLQDHNKTFIPFEKAHWRAAERVDDYRNVQVTSSTMNMVTSQLDYILDTEEDNFQLVGGGFEEINGTRMAHFVYHNDDKIVSVFLVDDDLMSIPDELKGQEVEFDGHILFDHNCRGCRLVFQRVDDAVIITATTERDVELLAFIPGHDAI